MSKPAAASPRSSEPPPPADELRDPKQQAASFDRTRRAHQNELFEDYAELIADLIDATGEARTVDLAKRLGVTHASVAKMLARMRREGLIVTRPYRSIFLTEAGRALADRARHRHQVVVEFLKALGVREEVAEIDAEGIEHHVSEETLNAFERVVRNGGPPGSDPGA